MQIQDILKELRKEARLPQEAVAERANTSVHTLSAYERGYSRPWQVLERVLDAYGYELEIVKKDPGA